jgi:TonB family protein
VGNGVTPPKPIYHPNPEYSEEARKAKSQGTVVLWIIVDPQGQPQDIRVVRSVGKGLDEKAFEAVRKWRFEPAKLKGQPVAVQINTEVTFKLY